MNPVSIPHQEHTPTNRGRSVTPEPATCSALLSAMQLSRWSGQVGRRRRRRWLSLPPVANFTFLFFFFLHCGSASDRLAPVSSFLPLSEFVAAAAAECVSFFHAPVKEGVEQPAAGASERGPIFLGGIRVCEVLPDRTWNGQVLKF